MTQARKEELINQLTEIRKEFYSENENLVVGYNEILNDVKMLSIFITDDPYFILKVSESLVNSLMSSEFKNN